MRALYLLLTVSLVGGCAHPKKRGAPQSVELSLPALLHFNGDSAYRHVRTLVEFGPRVPGTSAHGRAVLYVGDYLRRVGARVIIDTFVAKRFDGIHLTGYNIIGVMNSSVQPRILIASHWDTRPWADQDSSPALREKPFAGADDGASSTAVLLELARVISLHYPHMGVDLVFFDLEDQGPPHWLTETQSAVPAHWWCLGSQNWSRNPHRPAGEFVEGVLLDLVGSQEAVFPMEGFSLKWAGHTTVRLWSVAGALGYTHRFTAVEAPPVTDDHYYINTIAGIPTAAIIGRNLQTTSGFPTHWHTHRDSLPVVDKSILQMVGRVVEAWLVSGLTP